MNRWNELKSALVNWRMREKKVSDAVLASHHPEHIARLRQDEAMAVNELRKIADSEPWADMATMPIHESAIRCVLLSNPPAPVNKTG